MRKSKKKTVFVLGAGFTVEANAPLQTDIIRLIFELNPDELHGPNRRLFVNNRRDFSDFLERVLYISRDKFPSVALEDIYTPIDRCILDNISFRHISPKDLVTLRQKVNALIILLFQHRLERPTEGAEYINRFAKLLVNVRKVSNIDDDPFSVVSTNWDILLDNALKSNINGEEGVIDYCCYVTPFLPWEKIDPGLLARGKGKYNIKLLKLHGSMNWLHCLRCQRLFATFFNKIALFEFLSQPKCRLCFKNYRGSKGDDTGGKLVSNLLMPTFLKDLNNVQLKLIWQNAGVEFSEANKIVFIGYSFPTADFELRQLLARTIRHTAKIKVILRNEPHSLPDSPEYKDRPEYRYETFFGKRTVEFIYGGSSKYINDDLVRQDL
jgi:hypothetical protein